MKKNINWLYSQKVKDHFFNPKNFLKNKKPDFKFDGYGQVGSPACGDVMKFWIKIDPKTEKITNVAWQTYGCASAIASTSILSQMIIKNGGLKIKDALKIKPQDIVKELDGLPQIKIHCSVLGDQALKKAVENYYQSKKQHKNRIRSK